MAGSHGEPINFPQQGRLGFQAQEADRRDNRITVRSFSNGKRIRLDTKMSDSQIHLGPKAELTRELDLSVTSPVSPAVS